MKDATITLVGGGVGAATGYILSKIAEAGAHAAVKVRPNLGDATMTEAMLTNHFSDWLFYNHPEIAAATMIIMITFIGALTAWSLNEDI